MIHSFHGDCLTFALFATIDTSGGRARGRTFDRACVQEHRAWDNVSGLVSCKLPKAAASEVAQRPKISARAAFSTALGWGMAPQTINPKAQ